MVGEALEVIGRQIGRQRGARRDGGGEGYFPRGRSILRRVQGERSVGLLYGQRGLLIGALDARNFVGTIEHSRYREQPFKRLAATGKMFETVFFGSRAEADRVLAAVHRMHERVEGELGVDAGPFAGSRYRAFDPDLMLWTVAVAAESACCFYELLVRRMEDSERDAFWADWVRFGALFGMPREVAPGSWRELRSYLDGRLAGDEMHLTPEARRVGFGVAFRIPMGTAEVPAREVHNLLMLGSLPERVRELYGLGWSTRQELAFRSLTEAIRRARRVSPKRLARGRNSAQFDNVARSEARLVRAGHPPIRAT